MIDFNTRFGRYAKRQIKNEYFLWLTTLDSTGTPQPRPVWFVWEADTFLIYSQAGARKLAHIQKNPNVSLHFNSLDEKGESRIVIFTGTAAIDTQAPAVLKHRAYLRKYKQGILELNSTPEQFSQAYCVAIRVTPLKLRGGE